LTPFHDDKADTTLPQTKTLTPEQQAQVERVSQLEDQLNNMLACYRFHGAAILALTEPERLDDSEEWHLGLFLTQQWLWQLGEQLMAELVATKKMMSG
jgi:hypothetical protein